MALPFVVGLAVSAATRKAAMKGAKELAKIAMKKVGKAAKSPMGQGIIAGSTLSDIDEVYKAVKKKPKKVRRTR